MKILIGILFFLTSCTAPQIVSQVDKKGNPVHSVLKEPFFGSPSQASEWSFWYFVICAITFWVVWREFKAVRWPKKKCVECTCQKTEPK